jgi:hypothetical protein
MLTVEVIERIRVRHAGNERALTPGEHLELPDENARRLLAKAPDKVRLISTDSVFEPAINVRPVYWESCGKLHGPGRVIGFVKMTDAGKETFWLWVETSTGWSLISDAALRRRPICWCCKGTEHWESVYGVRLCTRCRPPSNPSVVSVRG